MPSNPYPRPTNWIELTRQVVRSTPYRNYFEILVQYPWFRRQGYWVNGVVHVVPLAFVEDVEVVLDGPGAARASRFLSSLQAGMPVPLVVFEIEDAATQATVTKSSAPLLAAHRSFGSETIRAELFWPNAKFRNQMWLWLRRLLHGTAAEQQAAIEGDEP